MYPSCAEDRTWSLWSQLAVYTSLGERIEPSPSTSFPRPVIIRHLPAVGVGSSFITEAKENP